MVKKKIGHDGGTISAEGISIEIPPGSVSGDVEIEIVVAEQEVAGQESYSPVFQFLPEGTTFVKPVVISMAHKGAGEVAIWWTREGSTDKFEQLKSQASADTVQAEITHFSLGFVGELLPPEAPARLQATPRIEEVHLSWSSVAAAETYRVYRAVGASGTYEKIAENLLKSSFSDRSGEVGTTYSYYVVGVNVKGEGAKSPKTSAAPQSPPPPMLQPTFLFSIGQSGTANGEFNRIRGLAFDGSTLWVSDNENYRVQRFTAGGEFQDWLGKVDGAWGFYTTGEREYFYTYSPIILASGGLFYASRWDGKLTQFSAAGVLLGALEGAYCNYCRGAVDSAGNVFVRGEYAAYKFDSSRNLVGEFGGYGTANGKLTSSESAIVIDSQGQVYALDTNRIQKFTNDGQYVASWPFPYAYELVIDENDQLYVSSNDELYQLNTSGQVIAVLQRPQIDNMVIHDGLLIGSHGDTVKFYSLTGQLPAKVPAAPSSLQVFGRNERIFIQWPTTTNAETYRVERSLTAEGPFEEISSNSAQVSAHAFLQDYFVDSGIRYYYRVTAMNARGESAPSPVSYATALPASEVKVPVFQLSIGQSGTANGEFNRIRGLAFDGSTLWVSDNENDRVQRFTAGGDFQDWLGKVDGAWGFYTTGEREYFYTYSPIILASGGLFYASRWDGKLTQFSAAGVLLGALEGAYCNYCRGAVDAAGNVFVRGEYDVYKFDSSHNLVGKFGGYGTANGKLTSSESAIVIDSQGQVYALDTNRIQKFTNDGQYVASWPFPYAYELVIDENDQLYVSSNDTLYQLNTAGQVAAVLQRPQIDNMVIHDGLLIGSYGDTVRIYALP